VLSVSGTVRWPRDLSPLARQVVARQRRQPTRTKKIPLALVTQTVVGHASYGMPHAQTVLSSGSKTTLRTVNAYFLIQPKMPKNKIVDAGL